MFVDQLHSLLEHCNSLHGSSIVLGDFNVHYDNPLNPTTSRVMDLLITFNLTQAVSQPTHDKGHILCVRVCACARARVCVWLVLL